MKTARQIAGSLILIGIAFFFVYMWVQMYGAKTVAAAFLSLIGLCLLVVLALSLLKSDYVEKNIVNISVEGMEIKNDLETFKDAYIERNDAYNKLWEETVEKEGERCGACGSKQVWIRGRYPDEPKRLICPTCAYERLEQINEISNPNYRKALTPFAGSINSK